MSVLDRLAHPIVQAPMAGGPSTPELAAAVCEAGGLGFLASGYRSAAQTRDAIGAVRERTGRPFGVNVFVPGDATVDQRELARFLERLRPEAERYGASVGEARFDDDDWQAKLELLSADAVAVVSFTFGCPPADAVGSLHDAGSEVWVTATTPAEARLAAEAGADAIVLQGVEAGGHRGSFLDGDEGEAFGILALLRLAARDVDLPLVAAGGIPDGAGVAAVLVAGAAAAQLGTAFMCADEAGTDPAQRRALQSERPTRLTRAFSGRRARGIVNSFMDELSDGAPFAYPHVHYATAPLRAAAREQGDPDGFNLWAGQAHRLCTDEPAAAIVRRLAREAQEALRR